MYDYTCISDALEDITHSLARWNLRITARCMTGYWIGSMFLPHPQQIEFARLNID